MKLDVYVCDRCGKEFNIKEGRSSNEILTVSEQDKVDDKELQLDVRLNLCDDCYSSFYFWNKYYKEFDELGNKLALKESGEE